MRTTSMLLMFLVLRELPRTRTRLRERRGFHGGSHHVGDGSAHNNASSNDHTSKAASTQACTVRGAERRLAWFATHTERVADADERGDDQLGSWLAQPTVRFDGIATSSGCDSYVLFTGHRRSRTFDSLLGRYYYLPRHRRRAGISRRKGVRKAHEIFGGRLVSIRRPRRDEVTHWSEPRTGGGDRYTMQVYRNSAANSRHKLGELVALGFHAPTLSGSQECERVLKLRRAP
jgi:hypothetical protein